MMKRITRDVNTNMSYDVEVKISKLKYDSRVVWAVVQLVCGDGV
jgi:hypothetical protein